MSKYDLITNTYIWTDKAHCVQKRQGHRCTVTNSALFFIVEKAKKNEKASHDPRSRASFNSGEKDRAKVSCFLHMKSCLPTVTIFQVFLAIIVEEIICYSDLRKISFVHCIENFILVIFDTKFYDFAKFPYRVFL